MAVPDTYAVTTLVNNEDVSMYIPHSSMIVEDELVDVSSYRFTLQNPPFVPEEGHSVVCYWIEADGEPPVFSGTIAKVNRVKHGIVWHYEIEALDAKERLQKSIVEFNDFTGTDNEIITDLFDNVYPPEIADLFDYEDAGGFASGLNLPIQDDSLLDALKDLKDLTGGNLSFKRKPIFFRVAFDGSDTLQEFSGAYPAWQAGALSAPLPTFDGIDTGGNPSNCYKLIGNGTLTYAQFTGMLRPFPAEVTFVNARFDIWFDFGSTDAKVTLAGGSITDNIIFPAAQKQTWISVDWKADASGLPVDGFQVQFRLSPNTAYTGAWETRYDNLRFYVINKSQDSRLDLKQEPDPSEWDLDIPTSNEYAWNIEYPQGSIDNVNSVVVIGGKTEIAVDEARSSDGEAVIGLPRPIKGLAVYRNIGSDVTPNWSALTVGIFGTDELVSAGGSKNVLYADDHPRLIFDTTVIPANMVKAFRITGFEEKPLRVRVENVSTGQATKTIPLYNDKITTKDEAVAYGNAELQRRAALRRLSFSTHHPGLRVGTLINVTDTDLDESLVINKITTTWLGSSGHATFEIECGEEQDANISQIAAATDKRSRKKQVEQSITTTAIDSLIDEDGSLFVDEDGELFEDG